MAEYGIWVSRQGHDVFVDNPRLMTLDSTKNMVKIHMTGYGTASVSTGVTTTVDIAHNLGYKPQVYFYFQHPGNSRWHSAPARADSTTGAAFGVIGGWDHQSTSTARLYLYEDGSEPFPSNPQNVNYRYIILVDPWLNPWSS